MTIEEHEVTWIDWYKNYLFNGNFPEDKIEAKKIWKKAFNYTIINDKLYRKSTTGPLFCCLTPDEARRLMKKIHKGVCDHHSGGRSLAHKALSIGYFWPFMMTEAQKFVRKCDKCQRFTPVSYRLAEPLYSITPWPFAR